MHLISLRRLIPVSVLTLLTAVSVRGQTNFYDNFESGALGNWAVVGTATACTISTTTNKVPAGGTYSAKTSSSGDRMYASSLGAGGLGITYGSFKLTYWLYDSTASRAYCDVRQYSGGNNSGTLQQLLMVGKFNSAFSASYFAGETAPDASKYQGRVAFAPAGFPSGYFNLNNPGSPARSVGWHRFDLEHGTNTDGTINLDFYVDGVLGRRLTNTVSWNTQLWNTVTIGQVAAGTTAGDGFFDGVQVVQGEPWVSQQPSAATNYVGTGVTLSAAVIGLPDTIYQWRKNGTAIPTATTTSYSLVNPQTSDSGAYSLFASNVVGTTVSSNAYLQVNPLNLVTVPPTNQTVNVGDPVTFYAEATGAGTMYYQWNKNGSPIAGATGSGASSTFSIGATTTNDAANYSVTVTNSAGDPPTTSSIAVLFVNTPPSIPTIADQVVTVSNYFSLKPVVSDDFDAQAQPFQAFDTNTVGTKVMFANSDASGTTGNMVDNTGRSYVTNAFPAGHVSAQALHVSWNWTNGNTACWLRLTTLGGGVSFGGDPIVYFNTPLRFDVYVDKDVNLAVGYRETNPTGAIGTDAGSSSAPIEWVGVVGPGVPPGATTTVTAGSWTTVTFDTNVNSVASFSLGNGFLDSTTGKGTLEHLALLPSDGNTIGQYTMYLDNFVSVPTNALLFSLDAAPAGATIDQYTGNILWKADNTGTYGFTIRATDKRGLFSTRSFNVNVGAAAPGALTISRNGTDVQLNWSGTYTLQSSTQVDSGYQDVSPAVTSAPYTVPPTNTALFFRLRN
jgi:hypothetical protein